MTTVASAKDTRKPTVPATKNRPLKVAASPVTSISSTPMRKNRNTTPMPKKSSRSRVASTTPRTGPRRMPAAT